MDQNSVGFMCFRNTFTRIGDAKTKEGVFVRPQVRELIQNVKFEDPLSEVEKNSMEIIKKYHYQFSGRS
jgi:hypothetical protein